MEPRLHRSRVRAPELDGAGGWIGVEDLSLARLRGTVVLLHFWTLGCITCLRTVEALRALERRWARELVVVGIHSPKFSHEHDHDAVRAAVGRHRIEHPVLDDPDLATWDAYAVRAWPTLVLVDAGGRVALTASGEGHAELLAATVAELVREARDAGSLRPGAAGAGAEPEPFGTGELAFPGKVAAARDGRLAIADTGHDRVLLVAPDGEVLEEHGGLYQPQGVAFDGDALLVCETGAGRVWSVGLGGAGGRRLVADGLASPWDAVRWRGVVVVAEAGRHRLVGIDADGELQALAGAVPTEGLRDGPAAGAVLAQPSGLAVWGEDLAFVDAESSALRVLRRDGLVVETLVGAGLSDWGHEDGDAGRARLQHPLGVAASSDGLYVADTYNGLLRVLRGAHLWTVPVEGFEEPGGVAVLPDGRVVVADTLAHRVVVVDPVAALGVTLDVGRPGSSDRIAAPAVAATVVAQAGGTLPVSLGVDLAGEALDRTGGAPVRAWATATDPGLLRGTTAWDVDALPAELELELGAGSGRITVELRAATCQDGLCRVRRTQRAFDVLLA